MWKKFKPNLYSIAILIIFLLATFSLLACNKTNNRAEYILKDQNAVIAIELLPMHSFLAEYDRFAVLQINGKEVFKKKLFPDSGGYSSTNLYRCNLTTYVLQGYFDSCVIDFETKTITEEKCKNPNPEYIGIFDGGGSKPWKFYSVSERKETKLEPKGGG